MGVKKLEFDRNYLGTRKFRTLLEFAFDEAISEYRSICAGSCIGQSKTEGAGAKYPDTPSMHCVLVEKVQFMMLVPV